MRPVVGIKAIKRPLLVNNHFKQCLDIQQVYFGIKSLYLRHTAIAFEIIGGTKTAKRFTYNLSPSRRDHSILITTLIQEK